VIPAVSWCHEKLKARKFFLVGSDYVWPHCVNEIVKDQLKALGASCAGEAYILFGSAQVKEAVDAIGKAKPDVIISTVVGDSNEPFYRQLQAQGIHPESTPVVSFGIAEDELRQLPLRALVGDYAAWNYFQTLDREENREFIRKFQSAYGADRVTSDVIVAAYNSVNLWAQAVLEAGSDDVADVLVSIRRQSLNAPEGIVSVDEETHHTWRPVYVGRIRNDGQFDVVWSSGNPVRPIPYPRSRTPREWETLLDDLNRAWGGWANPGSESGGGRRPAGTTETSARDSGEGAARPPARVGKLAGEFSADSSAFTRPEGRRP
jgi:urea transport system substrate-binding protein